MGVIILNLCIPFFSPCNLLYKVFRKRIISRTIVYQHPFSYKRTSGMSFHFTYFNVCFVDKAARYFVDGGRTFFY